MVLIVLSQVDLYFINLPDDLLHIGIDIRSLAFKVAAVVGFVDHHVLFHIGDLNVQLRQPDLHLNPDGDNGDYKAEQTDGLWNGESEKGVSRVHGKRMLIFFR